MLITELQSLADTEKFAFFIRKHLEDRRVIYLNGKMGSGKTHFTRYFYKALGGNEEDISSPTYTYMRIHEETAPLKLFHLDLYRLEEGTDFYEIGGEDLLSQNGILVIEWADKLNLKLPNPLKLHFTYRGATQREVLIENPSSSLQAHWSEWENRSQKKVKKNKSLELKKIL
jgi:tRNA threonylcarbamoyladenosine biosynthesis protein TsaE